MVCETRLKLLDRYNDAVKTHAGLVGRLTAMAGNGSSSSFESVLDACKTAKHVVEEVYQELFHHTREHGCGLVTKTGNGRKAPEPGSLR